MSACCKLRHFGVVSLVAGGILYIFSLQQSPLHDAIQISNLVDEARPLRQDRQPSVSELLEKQRRLQAKIHSVCSSQRLPPQSHLAIYADDRRHLVFCLPPKTGCTTWKNAIGVSSGKVTGQMVRRMSEMIEPEAALYNPALFVHRQGFMRLVGLRQIRDITTQNLTDYYKIMVVRDPFVRLVSAYQDKLLPGLRHLQKLASKMQSRRVTLLPNESITFDQLVGYIRHLGIPPNDTNIHLSTYQSLCRPCSVDYDYIIKMEDLPDEAEFISKEILKYNGSQSELLGSTMGPSAALSQHTESNLAARQYYCNLSKESKWSIRKYLWLDTIMFGYDAEKWLKC